MIHVSTDEEKVWARLSEVEASLKTVRLRASHLIEDAVDSIHSALMSDTWLVDEQLELIRSDMTDALYEAHTNVNYGMTDAYHAVNEVMATICDMLDTSFTALLKAIQDYLYTAIEDANREIQVLVNAVDERILVLSSTISLALESVRKETEETTGGLIDEAVTTLKDLFTKTVSIAVSFVEVAGDLVNPLVLGLRGITDVMMDKFTGLLTFEAEDLVAMQTQLKDAWLAKTRV